MFATEDFQTAAEHSRCFPSRRQPRGGSGLTGRSRRSCTFSAGGGGMVVGGWGQKDDAMSHVSKSGSRETSPSEKKKKSPARDKSR